MKVKILKNVLVNKKTLHINEEHDLEENLVKVLEKGKFVERLEKEEKKEVVKEPIKEVYKEEPKQPISKSSIKKASKSKK